MLDKGACPKGSFIQMFHSFNSFCIALVVECVFSDYVVAVVLHTEPDSGQTALHVAVSLNFDDITKQLLELGADPRVQDSKGCSAVMTACEFGHIQALEVLASRGISFTGKFTVIK